MVGESLQFDTGRYFSDHLSRVGFLKTVDEAEQKILLQHQLAEARIKESSAVLMSHENDPSKRLDLQKGFVQGGALALYAVQYVLAQGNRNRMRALVTAFGNDDTPLIAPEASATDPASTITALIDRSRLELPSVVPILSAIESHYQHDLDHGTDMTRFTQVGLSATALALNDLHLSGGSKR